MKRRGQYIVLSTDELKQLIEVAVAKGIRSANTPMLSRRQAEKEYGRTVISNLIGQGRIKGHRQGAAANSKVLFGRDEIERAIIG